MKYFIIDVHIWLFSNIDPFRYSRLSLRPSSAPLYNWAISFNYKPS